MGSFYIRPFYLLQLQCKNKKKYSKSNINYRQIVIKELIFAFLAVLSVALLAWELFGSVSPEQERVIYMIEVAIALLFLIDYMLLLYQAPHKRTFVVRNWYLLLASIPIVSGWAEVLKGLRLLVFIRLFRAGEHVYYAKKIIQTNHNKH